MARGRLISKSLSTSERWAQLHKVNRRLAEFAQSFYPLLVAHSDDFGRLPGDVFTVKHAINPTSPRKEKDFDAALDAMVEVGLIDRYAAAGKQVIQICGFDPHQPGLNRRTESLFAAPDGTPGRQKRAASPLNASEADVEGWLADNFRSGRLVFTGFQTAAVTRQVRKGGSYIDLLVATHQGTTFVVEVKRTRITGAAIRQVHGYCQLLGGDVIPVVIGHGLADISDAATGDTLIAVYDADLSLETATRYHVNSREITLQFVPAELKGTEPNGTEGNRAQIKNADQGPRAVARRSPEQLRMELRQMVDMRRHLRAACHRLIETGGQDYQADNPHQLVNLFDQLKHIAARDLRIADYDGRSIQKIIDAVLNVRARRAG